MCVDNSFYVISIATYAPTLFGYIISVLASVQLAMFAHLKFALSETKAKSN